MSVKIEGASRQAWARLLADILAGGGAQFRGRTRGGAMLEADRKMPPRMSDYGAGWAGEGVEVTARMSNAGHGYFNRPFYSGRSWSTVRDDY